MVLPLGLAIALALGVDPRRVALLAGAVYLPMAVVGLVVLVSWKGRTGVDNRPSLFCESVASELRAGSGLRDALTSAAGSVGGIELTPYSPLVETAAQLSAEFEEIGEELRLTIVNAARAGADTATLFDEIGSLAVARSEIRHEVRVATAPGRATAFLLVGAPLVYIVSQIGSGGLARMLASSQQRTVALIGLGLFTLGLAAATVIVLRAAK